jgi:two-component system response regulator YesN
MIKVLVVDDEPLEGDAIRFLLTQLSQKQTANRFLKERQAVEAVYQAYSGRTGVEMAQNIKPQIAFVDMTMPDMDGITTTKLLKQSLPSVKIVVLSAYDDMDDILKAIKMGANEYLLKPVRPNELLSMFDNLMYRSGSDSDHLYGYDKIGEAIKENSPMDQFYDKKLAEHIRSGDHLAARKLLCKLLRAINIAANGDIELIRTSVVKVAVSAIKLITEDNNDDNNKELLTLVYRSFIKCVVSAQTINTIENCLKDLIDNCSILLNKYPNDTVQELILKAKDYIQVNMDKEITLENVAQYVHLSPFYFSRLFKVKTGSNYVDFLIDLRLEKAKVLLLSTDDTISSIAKRVGYSEVNSFSRLFKNRLGIKPSEYRLRNVSS